MGICICSCLRLLCWLILLRSDLDRMNSLNCLLLFCLNLSLNLIMLLVMSLLISFVVFLRIENAVLIDMGVSVWIRLCVMDWW